VQRWLQAQPHEVAVVMAARAALRVLPIEPEGGYRSRASVVLLCFRAAATAWVAGKFPTHGVALRDTAAAAGSAANRSIAAPPYATDTYYSAAAGIDAAAYAAASDSKTATDNAAAAYAANAAAAAGAADARAAGAADATFIESAGDAADRRRLAITLAGHPLWPDGTPDWAEAAWSQMRAALLGAREGWDVWIALYDALLAGDAPSDPTVALAYATPAEALWDDGPQDVNAEIKRLLAEAQSKAEAQKSPELPPEPDAEPIPPQGPGPHFTLSPDLRIALAPPAEIDAEGNNLARIRQLLPPIRQAAADLAGNLNPNIHPELARIVAQYQEALGSESEAVPWGLLFGLGVRLQNAASAAGRDILDRMREPLEDAVQEALDSVLTLHGPLNSARPADPRHQRRPRTDRRCRTATTYARSASGTARRCPNDLAWPEELSRTYRTARRNARRGGGRDHRRRPPPRTRHSVWARNGQEYHHDHCTSGGSRRR
jgi:hypothetical protein